MTVPPRASPLDRKGAQRGVVDVQVRHVRAIARYRPRHIDRGPDEGVRMHGRAHLHVPDNVQLSIGLEGPDAQTLKGV